MTDNSLLGKSSNKTPRTKLPALTEEERKFAMIIRDIGKGDSDKMTEAHITEVQSQRKEIIGYIHEENMQSHERYKIEQSNTLIKLGGIIAFAVFILVLVALRMPNYLPQTLTLVVGFVGGFGLGKSMRDSPIEITSDKN